MIQDSKYFYFHAFLSILNLRENPSHIEQINRLHVSIMNITPAVNWMPHMELNQRSAA